MNNPQLIEEDEVSLKEIIEKAREYFYFFLSRWKTILLFVVVFASLGFIYSLFQKPKYVAQATLMLESGGNSGGLAAALQMVSQLGLGKPNDADKLVEIIKSKRVIFDALLRKETIEGKTDLLANHYIELFLKEEFSKDESLKDFKFKNDDPSEFSYLEDYCLNIIYYDLTNKYLGGAKQVKTDIVTVVFQSLSQEFARSFCQNLILSVNNFYNDNINKKERDMVNIIQHQVDSVRTALNAAEDNYAKWKDATSNRFVKAQGYLEEVRLRRNVEILNTMYAEGVKNLEIAKFSLLLNTTLVQVIDKPFLYVDMNIPKKIKNSMIFGSLGLLLSLGWLLLQKQMAAETPPQNERQIS